MHLQRCLRQLVLPYEPVSRGWRFDDTHVPFAQRRWIPHQVRDDGVGIWFYSRHPHENEDPVSFECGTLPKRIYRSFQDTGPRITYGVTMQVFGFTLVIPCPTALLSGINSSQQASLFFQELSSPLLSPLPDAVIGLWALEKRGA